ncbi:phage tail protein [Aeromonas caviae]|uniref:phage tail protein n=1 Tax=Aeromonas caviae TaxID=648 RepID=UPI00214DE431|nr:phage tail protein [Aeromonas caviae]MCR3946801.1 phage tail protein [Aeromonas caviae]
MSQVITNAFENYWQSCLTAEQPVVLDEFILADIPNLDITSPIDPDAGLPPESQIVHRQNVDQRGRINNNAVAYTIVMDTTVGDFSFNAMYLRNKQLGVIGMIVYKGREAKLKTDQATGQTGNSLVKSMLMGYDQAAEATLTNVDAGTWQIDYAARLRGMDEDIRQLQADLYGHHTFVGDGFKVVETDGAFQVTPGVAIVGGLRVELKQPEVIYPGTRPIGVWVDVHRAGSLLSEHQNHFTIITSVADLADHVDSNGYQHYVAKLAFFPSDGGYCDSRNDILDGGGVAGKIDEISDDVETVALTAREAIRRLYAHMGFNLVEGSFERGAWLLYGNDVALHEGTCKVYSGDAGYIEPGTVPSEGDFIDRSGLTSNGGVILTSAFGGGVDGVVAAVEFAKLNGISKVVCDDKKIVVSQPNRERGEYSEYMTWNYCAAIDGFDGEIDLSNTEVSVEDGDSISTRITVFVLKNCSGVFRMPRVKGNLRKHNMGVDYIDDSFIRIGGGCRNLKVVNDRLIEDYPGFGVMVRHYKHDNPSVSFAESVPENIDVVGRGGIIGCWSGGVVTVTGYDVTVTVNAEWNGVVSPLNGNFVPNIGHGVHFEAVTDGVQIPYVRNQRAVMCNTGFNRLNGLMFHTAIKNYSSIGNYSYGNGQYGAEYNAYADGLTSIGNVLEGNEKGGLLLSLSTASWAGFSGKSVGAEIRDDIKFNQGFGIYDLSHAKGVIIGGRIRRNKGIGYFAADGSSSNRNMLSNLIIEDNGDGAVSDVFAMTLTTEIVDNVTIINSNPSLYKQIPIRLKASRPLINGGVVVIGDSPTGVDVVLDGGQPARIPAGLSRSPMKFANGSFVYDRLLRGVFDTGQWLVPTGFDFVDLTPVVGKFPSYMLTDEANDRTVGISMKIRANISDATLTLRGGNVNGAASFTMKAGVVYTVTYVGASSVVVE